MIERENSCFCLCYDVKDSVEPPCKIFIATSVATSKRITQNGADYEAEKLTLC